MVATRQIEQELALRAVEQGRGDGVEARVGEEDGEDAERVGEGRRAAATDGDGGIGAGGEERAEDECEDFDG